MQGQAFGIHSRWKRGCAALLSWAGLLSLALHPAVAFASPQGGSVVGGSATIQQAGTNTTIQQTTSRVVINWQGFDIGAGESVNFQQPSSSAIALNRVTSGGASQIHGSLTANGHVWLINPQGVMFGGGAQVNVGGMVASTGDITDANFMAGHDVFDIPGSPDAQIINEGTITAADAGLVGLVAPSVNNSGVIQASLGKVQLASADTFALDFYGDGLISLQASDALVRQAIHVSGTIEAGQVLMSVAAAQETLSSIINMEGIVNATNIAIKGDAVVLTGELNAADTVSIEGRSVMQQGDITAPDVSIRATQSYLDSESASIKANGLPSGALAQDGGTIHIDGGLRIFASGSYEATGTTGGDITFEATDAVKLYAARVNVTGITLGGRIRVGGGYQGQDATIRNARETVINPTTILNASATNNGDGGTIIVWSDELTRFAGTAKATGGATGGDGGFIEISSKDTLDIGQYSVTDASAPHGNAGTLLLDPKNITISNTGITSGAISFFEFVDPNPDTGSFGGSVTTLSTGNVVITDTGDDAAASNAGAVYLFNGATGGLISTITGSGASDAVGSINALTNGNFVIRSQNWDNGGTADVGAVTWASGATGISGVISAANSLIGSTVSDRVGIDVTALSNGNYVVGNALWDNGGTANVGAVTWGNGLGGTVGVVSIANSLIGTTASDSVGAYGIMALPNGNYVIHSRDWDNGGATNAGAVTWCDGTTGCTGAVSAANSLVGSTTNDEVGGDQITVLSNGNYVVSSRRWDNGGAFNAGAVTWGNGLGGTVGAISAANSLVGSTANDQLGESGITALSNGNYVVSSDNWDNGGVFNAGAVTWGNGLGGTVGIVSIANSLVGTTASDQVGTSITALTNGNYVVRSSVWDNGGVVNAGAVTWGNGLGGTVGAVSAANSLVGSTLNDNVGNGSVIALTNGNYVVRSTAWDNGGTANVGAATWGNGLGGTVGAVSAANSLVGSTLNDAVGTTGVAVLSNGNYVVRSVSWDNGGAADAGAVTWGNGLGGTVGAVSAANSLVGSTASDQVGSALDLLSNGNYVVRSYFWDNGGTANVGAATWGNGLGGTVGAVSAGNSLVGSTAGDLVGSGGVTALTNGNYVVRSNNWGNGGMVDAGAVTWGDGTTGITGVVSAANSLVGSTTSDFVGTAVTALSNGNYVVSSIVWDNGGTVDAGAVTWGNGLGGTVGVVSAANSLVGSTSSDTVGTVTALSNGNYMVSSSLWDNGGAVNAGAATLCSATGGCVGAVTSANSIIGPQAAGVLNTPVLDAVNERIVIRFTGAQRIYSLADNFLSPSDYNFAYLPAGDVNLHPSFITAVLNAGTNVTLQASNDITVTDAVTANNPGGNGGTFTLQAGRSILLNANITTDNGNVNLYANDLAANGVVDAQRDAGAAVITMGGGTSINAGTGAVTIELRTGAGNTNNTAGDLTLTDITGASIFARNFNATGDVVLSGTLTASDAGDAITLVSLRNFINNAGAGALSTPGGRWLVYSTDPDADTIGGLSADFTQNDCLYGACGAIPGAGNGFLYSIAAAASDSADWNDRETLLDPSKSGLIEMVPCAISASSKDATKTLCFLTDSLINMEGIY